MVAKGSEKSRRRIDRCGGGPAENRMLAKDIVSGVNGEKGEENSKGIGGGGGG